MMVLTPIMPNCIRLHLNLPPHMSFKHVKYLLRQTPDLQYLILSGQKHLLKAKRWEKLLSLNCSRLLKFKFTCANYIYDENYQYDFGQLLDTFEEDCETSFWMERNITTSYLKIPFSDDDYRRDIVVKYHVNKTKQSIE
ncbi:unnamed protein product [Adineta steineri]|uniref:Uncharacterized protein n=1 Tax=Adineta steineri TaxID=433720 RepID=A0A814GJX3_9BILA|nr:unnamed protein product [Adineta steineri]CAF1216794.1 unnamed protein product [Adineta steineri]